MKRRTFDQAFKEHALNLWLGSGKSAREIAQELGIKPERLYTWKQALDPVPLGGKRAQGPSSAAPNSSMQNWHACSARINIFANNGIF